MIYNIRGQRVQVTDALRDYAEKKLSRLEKYFDPSITSEVNATLSVTKGQHTVEVTIPISGMFLRAEERSDDMYASIDAVIDKLERQIRKHKTKVNRRVRQTGGSKAVFQEGGNSVSVLEDEEDFELVRTKRFTFKPMDVEEAILQMNMLGHTFFVFSNSETKSVNVVYKRSDGKYGLIEQQ